MCKDDEKNEEEDLVEIFLTKVLNRLGLEKSEMTNGNGDVLEDADDENLVDEFFAMMLKRFGLERSDIIAENGELTEQAESVVGNDHECLFAKRIATLMAEGKEKEAEIYHELQERLVEKYGHRFCGRCDVGMEKVVDYAIEHLDELEADDENEPVCPECHGEVDDDDEVCPHCGLVWEFGLFERELDEFFDNVNERWKRFVDNEWEAIFSYANQIPENAIGHLWIKISPTSTDIGFELTDVKDEVADGSLQSNIARIEVNRDISKERLFRVNVADRFDLVESEDFLAIEFEDDEEEDDEYYLEEEQREYEGKTCPLCQNDTMDEEAQFCHSCGAYMDVDGDYYDIDEEKFDYYCPRCKAEVTRDTYSCPTCQYELSMESRYDYLKNPTEDYDYSKHEHPEYKHTCSNCEGDVDESAEQCPNCGAYFEGVRGGLEYSPADKECLQEAKDKTIKDMYDVIKERWSELIDKEWMRGRIPTFIDGLGEESEGEMYVNISASDSDVDIEIVALQHGNYKGETSKECVVGKIPLRHGTSRMRLKVMDVADRFDVEENDLLMRKFVPPVKKEKRRIAKCHDCRNVVRGKYCSYCGLQQWRNPAQVELILPFLDQLPYE